MRKYIISLILSVFVWSVSAQLSSTGNYLLLPQISSIDTIQVFLFNGITANTEISYNGSGSSINWYKYNDLSHSISNLSYISPDDATGYVLDVDGKRTNIWVMDYQHYLPVFTSFDAENNPSIQCDQLNLILNATVPSLNYQAPSGNRYTLPREFKVNYQTQTWTSTWQNADTTIIVTLPATHITVPAPLCNTTFTISGDQYSSQLGLQPVTFTGSMYNAVAVQCHITTSVTARTEKNEDMRPSASTPINYSAPIDVQFMSNANEPVAEFYKWEILKGNSLIISRTDKDHRYTFTQAGQYTVRLTASNANCNASDSITITVSQSAIYAPNVFTPNGDGFNDEFRVAYRSIISFDCWVYNRWGRLVYHWNDPQKGWNGTINGAKAAPGPYFYVIKALCSDYDPKSTPDPKTHLRLGEYVLKGDINLLRGKGY